MTQQSKTIQTFLPSGNPRDIKVAEITTRIIRVTEVPKHCIGDFLKMPEAFNMGICFFLGKMGANSKQDLYIAQINDVKRALQKNGFADIYWQDALFVTSINNIITQTHCAYLEDKCVEMASKTGRYNLLNDNNEHYPNTPDSYKSECEEFILTLKDLLTVLNYPLFEVMSSKSKQALNSSVLTQAKEVKHEKVENEPKADLEPVIPYHLQIKDNDVVSDFNQSPSLEQYIEDIRELKRKLAEKSAKELQELRELKAKLEQDSVSPTPTTSKPNYFTDKIKQTESEVDTKKEEEKDDFDPNQLFYFFNEKKNVIAEGRYCPVKNQFTVLKGSTMSLDITKSMTLYEAANLTIRNELIESGIAAMSKDGNSYVLTKDHTFTSPSAAGTVLLGSTSTGWSDWVNDSNEKLRDVFTKERIAKSQPKPLKGKVVFYFNGKKEDGFNSEGEIIAGKRFKVLKGSIARYENMASATEQVKRVKTELINEGVLVVDENKEGKIYRFSRDSTLSSVSLATGIVSGGTYSGWNCWVDENNLPISQYKPKKKK